MRVKKQRLFSLMLRISRRGLPTLIAYLYVRFNDFVCDLKAIKAIFVRLCYSMRTKSHKEVQLLYGLRYYTLSAISSTIFSVFSQPRHGSVIDFP